MQKLGFTIEERSGTKVLVYANGSCHPANYDEVAMWNMLQELQKQNELYRSLQDSDSFVYMDVWPDQPWTDEEFEIVNKHNAKFAGQFRKTEEGKLEFVDGTGRVTEVNTSVVGDPVEFVITPAFPEKSASFNPNSEQSDEAHRKLIQGYGTFANYIEEDLSPNGDLSLFARWINRNLFNPTLIIAYLNYKKIPKSFLVEDGPELQETIENIRTFYRDVPITFKYGLSKENLDQFCQNIQEWADNERKEI